MFTLHLQIFEVYEPFRHHTLSDSQKLQVLRAFLTCKFTPSTLWKKIYFPPFWYLDPRSYYFKSRENLACVLSRTREQRCFPAYILLQRFINKCAQWYDSTVVKELSSRIPGKSLSSIIPLLIDPTVGADIRLLHIVRDPRASINSRIKLGWFPEYNDSDFERNVRRYCDVILKNVQYGQTLNDSLRDRYKLIFYRDITTRPFETAKEIFEFAQQEMSDKILDWILNTTKPDKTQAATESRKPYSVIRDSDANIDKWRCESPLERTRIIEKACQPLLELIQKIRFQREYLLN